MLPIGNVLDRSRQCRVQASALLYSSLIKITLFNIIHTQSSIAYMLDNFSQAAINKEEQRRREVDARMRAVGVSSSSGSGYSAGFASSDGESLGGRL
jgi:hypothetical protein